MKCKIIIEGTSGTTRPFVLEDLTECVVEAKLTDPEMARWLTQMIAENPWIFRDCGVSVESTRMFTIAARIRMERLNEVREQFMAAHTNAKIED